MLITKAMSITYVKVTVRKTFSNFERKKKKKKKKKI